MSLGHFRSLLKCARELTEVRRKHQHKSLFVRGFRRKIRSEGSTSRITRAA